MGDPNLLRNDEIAVEYEIRGIQPSDPQALNKLCFMMKEEAADPRLVPARIHKGYQSVSHELSVILGKLAEISPRLKIQAEDPRVHELVSLLQHLESRAARLLFLPDACDEAVKVHAGIKHVLHTCLKAIIGNGDIEHNNGAVGGIEDLHYSLKPQQAQDPQEELNAAIKETLRIGSNERDSRDSMGSREAARVPFMTGCRPRAIEVRTLEALDAGAQAVNLIPPPQNYRDDDSNTRLSLHTVDQTGSFRRSPLTESGSDRYAANIQPRRQPQFSDLSLSNERREPPLRVPDFREYRNRASEQPRDRSPSRVWVMAKWPLKFSGSPKDMFVDEFLFRVETLARLAGLRQESLTLGLHQLLSGVASSWYWVYLRNEPDATWAETKVALTSAFQSNVSDAAIRRTMMDRLQRQGERFAEFCIAMQEMEVRLNVRMGAHELLEVLQRNMLPSLQDRLLFVTVNSLRELQQRVQQIEELVQRQAEVNQLRRVYPRIHEIAEPVRGVTAERSSREQEPPSAVVVGRRDNPVADSQFPVGVASRTNDRSELVCALDPAAEKLPYIVCWNCDDLGHTFMDCTAPRIVFCYGCGAKNVYRPQCTKCNSRVCSGNERRNIQQTGHTQVEQSRRSQMFQRPDRYPRSQ